ncbi:hypothetical protein RHMOL_Rhmol07G0020100 [Rhododendron molle]|uniref:Uncharacterized protein n=1 Tax=Rhododendron molle TaxID=49168 RepID=A0ACC0MX45_RHOML|nr:hypothetical protein RHMOL_Rhmol07G0020100 [Rhododendron molle]
MGRTPCCEKKGLKKGPWTPEEDERLIEYINKNGQGSWRALPKLAGLLRCGKSCRLRWTNYLRPDIKRGPFSSEEEKLVIQLHGIVGNRYTLHCALSLVLSIDNIGPGSESRERERGSSSVFPLIAFGLIRKSLERWAAIASQLPGRTDNEIKNLWNTHLKRRLVCMGIDPQTHEPMSTSNGPNRKPSTSPSTRHMAQWESARLEAEARLSKESLLFIPPSLGRTSSDYFLRIWNSEVGESFRDISKGSKNPCQSSISQASSSTTRCGSVSVTTAEIGNPLIGSSATGSTENGDLENKLYADDSMDISDSSSSIELEDSCDTALQLLFDFPANNDMSFLEHSDDYTFCDAIMAESSLNCSP